MLNFVRAWIVLSAVLCSAGWVLSLRHQLNRIGYAVVFGLMLVAALIWVRRSWQILPAGRRWKKLCHRMRRRMKHALPLIFCALAFAAALGGALYPPDHADALQYRTPRVLHWLAASQWHWIHAEDLRLNVISCGFEWLSAPLLLFTQTDRWLFVINTLSYLMLPGLIFGVFRQLGVRPRVAWAWMWILPSGWVYAMQAGGLGNDHFSTVYCLASVYFALRSNRTKQPADLWLSLLACALATGTKQTNVPLALLWFIAAWPSLKLFWQRPFASAAVAVLALLASGVPIAAIDLAWTGHWTGWGKGQDIQPESPFWGIIGNAFVLTVQNFMPPVFPFVAQWNAARVHFLQTSIGAHFTSFENFAAVTRATGEQTAALGLTVSLLALVSVVAARLWRVPRGQGTNDPLWSVPRLLRIVPWLLLLVFMAKVGSWNSARYLAPYYPLLFPALLRGAGHNRLIRLRWWKAAAALAMVATLTLLVISRQRPLWPADPLTAQLQQHFPQSNFVRKLRNAYVFGQSVRESLQPLLRELPPGERTVGYATRTGGLEVQLWLPFGSRHVVRVLAGDTAEALRQHGVRYVFVEGMVLHEAGITIEEWAHRHQAEVVGHVTSDFGPEMPGVECHLTRLLSTP